MSVSKLPAKPALALAQGSQQSGRPFAKAVELRAGRQPLYDMQAPTSAKLGVVHTQPGKNGR